MSNPFRQSDRTPGQAGTGVPAPQGPRVSWRLGRACAGDTYRSVPALPAQHSVACRPSTAVLAKLASSWASGVTAIKDCGWLACLGLAATRRLTGSPRTVAAP